jgi:hypothetical protein
MCQFNLEGFVVSYPIIVTHNTIIRLDIALCQQAYLKEYKVIGPGSL